MDIITAKSRMRYDQIDFGLVWYWQTTCRFAKSTKRYIDCLDLHSESTKVISVCATSDFSTGNRLTDGNIVKYTGGSWSSLPADAESETLIVCMNPEWELWMWMQSRRHKWQTQERYWYLVQYCADVAEYQCIHNKYFVTTYPTDNTVWKMKPMKNLANRKNVRWNTACACNSQCIQDLSQHTLTPSNPDTCYESPYYTNSSRFPRMWNCCHIIFAVLLLMA